MKVHAKVDWSIAQYVVFKLCIPSSPRKYVPDIKILQLVHNEHIGSIQENFKEHYCTFTNDFGSLKIKEKSAQMFLHMPDYAFRQIW